MTSARDQQIEALLRAALERPPEERAAFITEQSGVDQELCHAVEALLSRQDATQMGADAAEDRVLEFPAGTLIGHYRIDAEIGRGGMGVVYRATDTKLGRSVAMKFLSSPGASPEAKQRFRQEAKTASSLNHPHIVTVHDVGEHEGLQYIVSELVDGGTLDDWASSGRRTWRQSVELLTGVADALAAANAAGVLHRDVKPGNILIGSNGYAKLADFGLAKLVAREARASAGRGADATRLTGAGVVVGTVAYMSPEQTTGQPLDARSDIFSFGIVLYELLAGRRPFDAANELGTLKAITHATPEPLPLDVPDSLRSAVDKALEKDPADRYQAMKELVVDLRRATRKGTSSQAVTVSDARIVAGVAKRHPRLLLGAVAVLALVVAGAVWFFRAPGTLKAAGGNAAARAYEIAEVTTSGDALNPAISPDGRYVAYLTRRGGGPAVLVRQIATSRDAPVVPTESGVFVGGPSFEPDGEFVDFLRSAPGIGFSMWRVPFLGGAPKLLAEHVTSPAGWSPDGRQLAVIRSDDMDNTSLVIVDTDGAERVLATRHAPDYLVSLWIIGRPPARPAWSPDGKRVAVLAFSNFVEPQVIVIDVATSRETVIPSGGSFVPQGLAWLGPTSLVVSQPEEFNQRSQLWTLSYPDGHVAPLTNDLGNYISVDVDRSRTRLVTNRRDTRMTVWVGDANGDAGKEVVPPTPFGAVRGYVAWAGERVLYDTTSNGRAAIGAVSPDGTGPAETVASGFYGGATADGGTLVFIRSTLGADGLWRVDSAGRQPTRLVPGFKEFGGFVVEPVVTPNGRYVVFNSNRGGVQGPWMVPIDGGDPVRIPTGPESSGGDVDVSPDSTRITFAPGGPRPAVVVCDFPTCANRLDLAPPANFNGRSRWTPDGRDIAYVDATGVNIWAMPLDGGPPRQLTHFADAGRPAISAFAYSHDGRRLAIVRTTTANDVVLLRLK